MKQLSCHLIHFELGNQPQVIFKKDYRPATGPLPELRYDLTGLWVYENVVVRAIFKAPQVPMQNGELIFHRYESETITHQGQASYRYFSAAGYAGMILTKKALAKKLNVLVNEMWFSFSNSLNKEHAALFVDGSENLVVCAAEDQVSQRAPILFATVNVESKVLIESSGKAAEQTHVLT